MKNIFKYHFAVYLLVGILILIGCKKDDDEVQGPTVTITSLSPDPVFQGDPVTTNGENLNTVQHVFVNQLEARKFLNLYSSIECRCRSNNGYPCNEK